MTITEDEIQLTFDESPDVNSSVQMLFELVGISAMASLKKVLPVVQRDQIKGLMQAITAPSVKGMRIVDNAAQALLP